MTINTEFSTDNLQVAEMLQAIERLPRHTVERVELEGHLFTLLARVSFREADRMRASERQRRARAARRSRA